MRNRFSGLVYVVLIVALALSAAALAQNGQAQNTRAAKPSQPVDPHDISGVWRPTGYLAVSQTRPPLTDWGKAKFATTRTAWGKGTGNEAHAPLAYGFYSNQTIWNDPVQWCDPAGYPRSMWWVSGGIGNFRFVQTPTEVLQFFERDHIWRDLWTDGRKLPATAEPRWYGYSVAHWDGDTFVVESAHFNDRAWLDQYGSIQSDQMKMEERYRRPDHDHMELTMTITDPKAYTAPWVGEKKVLNWQASSDRVPPDTWGKKSDGTPYQDIREEICAYSDSAGYYKHLDFAGVGGKFGAKPTSEPK